MEEKIKAQICFAKEADLKKVKEQLQQLKAEGTYEFHCCFLPRHIVEEKGWDTEIVDLLEEELGNELVWELEKYENFDAAMGNISGERERVANLVNRMFVLDSKEAQGVAEEIKLFTQCKVILL